MSHTHKFTLKRKFVHEQICPKEMFDPKSFRRVKSGEHRVTVACPKGKYSARVGRCKVGLKTQNLLHPVKHFKERFPSKYARLKKGKPVKMTSSVVRHYCPA
jgi:hypothetical protein